MTNILQKAIDLVGGDRATTYGDMFENHQNIAKLWDGYLHNIKTVSSEDAANMMELLKIARRKTGKLNDDDYIDGAGYAAVAYDCAKVIAHRKESKTRLRKELDPGLNLLFSMEPQDPAAENKRLRAGLEEIRDVAQVSYEETLHASDEWYVMLAQKILDGDTDMRGDE